MAGLPVELDATDVKALLAAAPGAQRLIDCREADEWDICHIEGAELLPLSRFVEEVAARLRDKEQRLIVYCHHGVRSLRATSWLRQQGFAQAQSMTGGIAAWADYVDPEMPRY